VGASADQDVGVRRRGELASWLERDPIQRAELQLSSLGTPDVAAHRAAIDQEIALALATARRAPAPDSKRTGEYVCVR
jgi:TPP-dependent pyruvate/acetoin dehydrogenase alpha subunit